MDSEKQIPREAMMGDVAKPAKLGRNEIIAMLEKGDRNFDGFDLVGVDVGRLNLRGATFRGSDVRSLNMKSTEAPSDASETDWTNALFPDQYGVDFEAANFEKSLFASTGRELLNLCMVNASHATFRGATFKRCYFGGETGYGFESRYTNLTDVLIEESDMSQFDLTDAAVDGIRIVNCQIERILIKPDQLDRILRGLEFTDPEKATAVEALKQAAGGKNIKEITEATQKLGISFGEFDISVLGQ